MGNFLQKAPAARPSSPPHTYALASTPLEELADSAHEQSMNAHTMQATLRLLVVGQAPIEPWKLVGEPPRGVSRATSLRSLTSMRLTPCPVALPRSWLSSAAASVTIGELEEEEHPRRGLTFLLSGLDAEEQIHVRALVLRALCHVQDVETTQLAALIRARKRPGQRRPPSPPHTYALASTPLEELADSAHEQSMSAHTMQATLRLLVVGQTPIEPWKLVGEPPRGVSRATSLRSLTSMRLTPCPVALPRSWLSSAAASVTIGELEEEEHPRRGLTFLLSGLDDEEQIHVRALVLRALCHVQDVETTQLAALIRARKRPGQRRPPSESNLAGLVQKRRRQAD